MSAFVQGLAIAAVLVAAGSGGGSTLSTSDPLGGFSCWPLSTSCGDPGRVCVPVGVGGWACTDEAPRLDA